MLRVRTLVAQHLAKADEEKTTDFLYAASKGNNGKVRQVSHCPACRPAQPVAVFVSPQAAMERNR